MRGFTKSHVEQTASEWLSRFGYAALNAPNGSTPGRVSYDQVSLTTRLRVVLNRPNRHLRAKTRDLVASKLMSGEIRVREAEKHVEEIA